MEQPYSDVIVPDLDTESGIDCLFGCLADFKWWWFEKGWPGIKGTDPEDELKAMLAALEIFLTRRKEFLRGERREYDTGRENCTEPEE